MHFRPGDIPQGDPTEPNSPIEWADNRVSNTFAWGAYHVVPTWCQKPEHWTSRLTQYLFVDCPCCLLFRGITVGILFALSLSLLVVVTAIGTGAFLAWLSP